MKKIILTAALSIVCLTGFSQIPSILWSKSFGGFGHDFVDDMTFYNNGGDITVLGHTNSSGGLIGNNYGVYDAWIVRVNMLDGALKWKKLLGGERYEVGSSIRYTSDGGNIVGISSDSTGNDITNNNGQYDYWIVKLDAFGQTEWQKSYGGTGNETISNVEEIAGGGYIVAGDADSNDVYVNDNHGLLDYWVLKLDAVGDIVWKKSYGGSSYDNLMSMLQTPEGGYILMGGSASNDGDVVGGLGAVGNLYCWIVKLDVDGNILWQKEYQGTPGYKNSFCKTADGYAVLGSKNTGGASNDMWLLKIDNEGVVTSDRTYPQFNNYWLTSIQQTSDSGYIIGGDSLVGTVQDALLLKLDSNGDLQWQRTAGGSDDEVFDVVKQIGNGGYIAAGTTNSTDGDITNNFGFTGDYWVVRFDSGLGTPEFNAKAISIYPNPTDDLLYIKWPENVPIDNIKITDLTGKQLYCSKTQPISTKFLAAGVYLIEIKVGNITYFKKFVRK